MANISHQSKIENKKFRNWVKAGLGLKYVKEGLEGFCDDIVKQQQSEILTKVKKKRNLPTVNCGLCNLQTLQPDHVREKSKQCPLGQTKCNCQHPKGKIVCSNNVCGAIYDEIIQLHASVPPAPFWKNSDVQKWCSEPWSIATCFINAPGYTQMFTASEIDCSGLLHVLINNTGFQNHLKTVITGTDVFSKVRGYRNRIFHSDCMELEENDVNTFLDDMISVLQDDKELRTREESKSAVKNLLELKSDDFKMTTTHGADVQATMTAIKQREIELEQKVQDYMDSIELKRMNTENFLQRVGSDIQSEVGLEIEKKGASIELDTLSKLVQKGYDIESEIQQKGADIEQKGADIKREVLSEIEQKGDSIESEKLSKLVQKGYDIESEIRQKGADIKLEIEQKGEYLKNDIEAKLVNIYKDHLTNVSVLPLLPERNQIDINDVYVAPMLTIEIDLPQGKNIALHEMFETDGKQFRNIFVLGEAGSGKSALCKSLISHWCLTHSTESMAKEQHTNKKKSQSRPQIEEIEKRMKNFEFLFYVSLRHSTNFSNVEMMLKDIYDDQALECLKKESSKCLILLDGLDEWTEQVQKPSQFQTEGLPSRNIGSDYTIITTSRQWKFDSLHIKHSGANRIIKLIGIDKNSVKAMSEKTISAINKEFDGDKDANEFSRTLQRSPVVNMSQVPLILQQLICLWYDDTLNVSSKCAIYSSMLNLFFEWSSLRFDERKHHQSAIETSRIVDNVHLPEFLRSNETCCRNTHIIQNMSRLAFETLFGLNKKHRLCFPSSAFDVDTCLGIGILSAHQNMAFLASKRQNLSFSFVDKSIQEYLCAVYIATEFEEKSIPSTEEERHAALKDFVHQYFGKYETIGDVLEDSDVYIMLSELEPELTRYITEYIYNIVSADSRVLGYRTDFNQDTVKLIENIQKCLCGCIKESVSSGKQSQSSICLGDVLIKPKSCPEDILPCLAKGIIKAESVRSMFIEDPNEWYEECAMKYLTTCTQVKSIRYKGALLEYRDNTDTLPIIYHDTAVMKTNEMVAKVFVQNIPNLESIVLDRVSKRLLAPLLQVLPDMSLLTTLHITNIKVPHEYCDNISSLLERCTHVQQLVLAIKCNYEIDHAINLAKHYQISCVNFFSVTSMESILIHRIY